MRGLITFLLTTGFLIQSLMAGHIPYESSKTDDSLKIAHWTTRCKNLIYNEPDSSKHYIDSILQFSVTYKNDYGRYVGNNLKGSWFYIGYEMDSAIFYYHKAYQEALNAGFKNQCVSTLGNIALAYKAGLNFDSALRYYDLATQLARKYEAKNHLARNLVNLNYIYGDKGNYLEAALLLFEAKSIGEELSNHTILSLVNSSLGNLYDHLGNPDLSIKHNLLAIHHDTLESEIYSLPSVYLNLGASYVYKKEMADSARYYFNKALKTARSSEIEHIRMAVDANVGIIYFRQNNLDSAFYYLNKVYNNPFHDKNHAKKASVTANLGIIYFMKKDFGNSKRFLNQGYEISDSLNLAEVRVVALEWLIRLDSLNGNFASAFEKAKLYNQLTQKMQKSQAENGLTELEIKRELDATGYQNQLLIKENQLKSQQINNQKIFSFVSVLILAGAIFFTIIQIRNRKQISLLNKNLLIRKNELEIANSTLLENNKLLIAQQTKLKELNDSKDKFISILGHDLKSPFSGILGVFDYLVQEWHKTDNNTKYRMITAAQQSALSTFELLEELLYWGKSQQGLIVLQPSNIKASDLIGEVVDLYQNSSEKKSQRMEVNIEPDMQLNTDMRLLKQVIQNFVGNAIKFTHHHGIIRIEGKTGNEKVCISVTDSGIGIPADTIDKLFDLNSNYGRPGTDKEKSTGMGLILCHEYARIMGATLEVSSTEGKGSTFSICFPKHSDKTDL